MASTKKISKAKRSSAAVVKSRSRAKKPAKPPLVRGEIVVQKVLDAAIHELAHVGYQGFRMEEVAIRAEVNKTTVYRRWPTKPELVRDALTAAATRRDVTPDTGSLRADLFVHGQTFAEYVSSPLGQSIFRMLAAEGSDPDLADIVKSLRERAQSRAQVVIANAVARGELVPGVNHLILIQAFVGALHHRIFMVREPVTDAYLTELIDLLLHGAMRGERAQSSART